MALVCLLLAACTAQPDGSFADGGGQFLAEGKRFKAFIYRHDGKVHHYATSAVFASLDDPKLLGGIDLYLFDDNTYFADYFEVRERDDGTWQYTDDVHEERGSWKLDDAEIALYELDATLRTAKDHDGEPALEITFGSDLVSPGLADQKATIIQTSSSGEPPF